MPKYCASGLCKNNAKDNPSKKFALFVQTAGRNKDLERAKTKKVLDILLNVLFRYN